MLYEVITKPADNEDRIDFSYLDQERINFGGAERDIFNFGRERVRVVAPEPEVEEPVEVQPPVVETVTVQPPPMEVVNRALSQFTFVGFLEKGGEKTVFLSSSGEMFLVKSGERFGVITSYSIHYTKLYDELGIPAIALFPNTLPELKSDDASEAYNENNLIFV